MINDYFFQQKQINWHMNEVADADSDEEFIGRTD